MVRFGNRAIGIAALAVTIAAGIIGAPAVLAQDATPTAGMAEVAYPNHIHEGTCADLNPAPKFPLADLMFMFPETSEMATPMAGGEAAAIPVAVATTVVDVPLADIIAGGHAINVHGNEDVAVYIACGNISGTPDADGNLVIGLGEQNGSGFSGIAWLQGSGAETTVTVFLSNNNL